MLIGIDASRAFLKNRTGIEEYSYQTIKNLKDKLNSHQVVLYIRKSQSQKVKKESFPTNWRIKVIRFPYLWTQVGLSLEMLLHPVDVLFIPAHTVPLIHPARNASLFTLAIFIQKILKTFRINTDYNRHGVEGGPKNTIVTIHGLEYEFCPQAYSFLERLYMRCSIKNSCKWASMIIAVSENTKLDIMRMYSVDKKKIQVVYEGYAKNYKLQITNDKFEISSKYLLFIGRLEERKNIINIIKAFEILKERYGIPHKLVLAGKPGHGHEKIKSEMLNINCSKDIVELGFVSEEEKWQLLKKADVFVFPTLYEGFGIPILEAQSVGCPVVAANNSSIPEVVQNSALMVDPQNAENIAESVQRLISDETLKNDIIQKGYENVKRFSWEKCAGHIASLLNV